MAYFDRLKKTIREPFLLSQNNEFPYNQKGISSKSHYVILRIESISHICANMKFASIPAAAATVIFSQLVTADFYIYSVTEYGGISGGGTTQWV